MHAEAYAAVAQMVMLIPEVPARVIEVGSANVNGSIRDLFGGCQAYLGLDRRPGRDVDLVADAWTWHPADPVEAVVCCEVLEHVPDGAMLARRLLSWLVPGGHLLLTWATPSRPPHGIDGDAVGPGEWYRGIPLTEVVEALETGQADIIWAVEDPAIGDAYLLACRPVTGDPPEPI